MDSPRIGRDDSVNPLGIVAKLFGGSAVKDAGKALDDLFTSDEEKRALDAEVKKADLAFKTEQIKADVAVATAQIDLNKTEAQNPHLFVSGWRPAIGWTCALALFYQFLLLPLLTWLSSNVGWTPPPTLDIQTLTTIVFSMLGMAGLRTYEKTKEVETKGVSVGKK
jgi:hypothetical protein